MRDDAFEYDAFISFDESDGAWVRGVLLPRLTAAGRTVRTYDDFEPGARRIEEIADAVKRSRKTVLVATAAYQASEWGQFEGTLVQTLDPAARKRRLVPVALGAHPLPLPIRPLVSVDLTGDDAGAWRRLLEALDPSRPSRPSPAQGLSLALADAMPDVGWNATGLVLGVIGLGCAVALAALAYLFVQDWPRSLQNAVVLAATLAAAVIVVGIVALAREDRNLGQRLSQVLGRSGLAKTGLVALVGATAAMVWTIGVPKVDCITGVTCGRVFVAPFANLDDAKRIIGQKLAAVARLGVARPQLHVYGLGQDRLTDEMRPIVNRVVHGEYVASDGQVTAIVEHADGRFLTSVLVAADRVESPAERLELYTEVTAQLLTRLGVHVNAELRAAIAAIPTTDLAAWDHKRRGDALLTAGRLDEAAAQFEQAIARDGAYADAHDALGTVLERQGSWQAAAASYERAIDALPGYEVFAFNLGNLLRRSAPPDDVDDAIGLLEGVIERDPTFVAARAALGETYLDLGRIDDARDVLEEGLRLEPESAPLHNDLGLVEVRSGQLSEAVAWFEAASRLDATYAPAHLNHAEALTVLDRWREAAAVYERAASALPGDPIFPYRLGVLYAEEAPEAAVAPLEEALRIAPDFVAAHHVLGEVLVDLGNLGAARRYVDEGLRVAPDYAPLHNALGLIERADGEPDRARLSFERASQLDPAYAEALQNHADVLDVLGRPQEAVRVQERADLIVPTPIDPFERFVRDDPILAPRCLAPPCP